MRAKLKETLKSLEEDGFSDSALAPLRDQLADLDAQAEVEASRPAITDSQRRIITQCDTIDREATLDDEDSLKRLSILKRERTFLLDVLLRESRDEYLALLPQLGTRNLQPSDYPVYAGRPMDSEAAVEEGLAAARAAQAEAEARAAQVAEETAAREEVLATAELEREAAAMGVAADGVDATFAICFLTAEEVRFNIEHRVVGVRMWSDDQQAARLKNVRQFLEELRCGAPLADAFVKLGRDDKLRLAWDKEAKRVNMEAAKATRDGPATSVPPTVIERFEAAWSDRDGLVANWRTKLPVAAAADPIVDTKGLSAVGRMRVEGAGSDSMSKRAGSDGTDPTSDLNRRFDQWLDDNRKQ